MKFCSPRSGVYALGPVEEARVSIPYYLKLFFFFSFLGFKSQLDKKFFSSPKHIEQLWGPTSFLFNGYPSSFPE